MSNDNDISLGGKDWYISLASIERANEYELHESELESDLDEIGDILLFSGKTISARSLNQKGISPSEWRWAIHESKTAIHGHEDWSGLEACVVKDLLNLGRRYAVARYAKWESITYHSALTATFPHGFIALLDQFLTAENATLAAGHRHEIQSSVRIANAATDLTAYHRTAIIRSAIHKSAIDAHGLMGHLLLDSERMRNILSLTRLYYCVCEIRVQSVSELNHLEFRYEDDRAAVKHGGAGAPSGMVRQIRNWELRHLHPLTYLYPYSIRNAIHRAREPISTHYETNRIAAINELAMARCQIMLMRIKANTSGYTKMSYRPSSPK